MVLPLIIGVGVTVAALTLKSGIQAYIRYQRLTPSMIASLNKIRISHEKSPDPKFNVLFEQFPGGFNSKMTENEALLILGITEDEIMHLDTQLLKKKHRKCMIQNHPDKGGSPYMAMKINQAKEILDASYMVRR